MTCSECGERKARRPCPALHHDICSVCCGTKRQVEIRCPADCRYLASAQAHPAAVVKRQQEADLAVFLPTIHDLTEAQATMLWPLLGFLRNYRGDTLTRTTDDDVVAAAASLASTFETSARGLIYEERPTSLPAQRLATDLKPLMAELTRERGSSAERDLALVLRAIERGAREARKSLPGESGAYLGLLQRLVVASNDSAPRSRADAAGEPPGGSLLIRP